MQTLDITLVAGPSGAGKTTWIQQQLQPIADRAIYFSLGADETAIDSAYLAATVSGLMVLPVTQLADVLARPLGGGVVYLELGFHIDLASLILPDPMVNSYRVAVLPPGTGHPEWSDWADVIVPGADVKLTVPHPQLWRSILSGQVLDLFSLNTFWYELTNGAYGTVQRAKGMFDIATGRPLYFDFVAGLADTTQRELDLPLCLNGRPDRFSGIEVVGERLDQAAIAQTIQACCLEDQAIAYYQQQMRELLESQE